MSNLERAIEAMQNSFAQHGKLLIAGNGGSAADAQHFAAELLLRHHEGGQRLPAIALTADTSVLTAWSNAHDYHTVFAKQIEALGRTGDVFIAISTSGNSPNVVEGVKRAKALGLCTIALLGRDGGELRLAADISIVVPAPRTSDVQEIHTVLIHFICERFLREHALAEHFSEAIALCSLLKRDRNFTFAVQEAADALAECFAKGGKLLAAGNGGSAARAQHFVAEIVGRYERERRGYPAVALTTDTSILTAWSNDYSFDGVFARQIEALGKPGDIFFSIFARGSPRNIIDGIEKAKECSLKTISLLGRDDGEQVELSDIAIIVPSDNTSRVQEIHALVVHALCAELEKDFT